MIAEPGVAHVFVARRLPGNAIERLAGSCEVDLWDSEDAPARAEMLARVASAEALLCTLVDRVDSELIDAAPRLRAIANYAVGFDNIDLAAAARRDIAVGNTPDVLTDATADLAFALLLAAARKLEAGFEAVRSGAWSDWKPEWLAGAPVFGRTLLVVGAGRIGRAVERRAAGFEMEVLNARSATGQEELRTMLGEADFVSLHVPLTERTRGMVDASFLAAMRPTAFLVNTARGGLVDQTALAEALRAGTIAGAALDVTDPEPLPPGDPLLAAPNLSVLPHLGSATREARAAMAEVAVDNLLAALDGRPMPYPVALP